MTITQEDLVRFVNNPGRGIDYIVNELENNWFDRRLKINSKSHPFIFGVDIILGASYGVLNRVDDSIAKLFPAHARSISDLSRHMSDEEKVGMFGNPSVMTVEYAIAEETFMAIAKDYTATMGKSTFTYKLLLLPKDTEVTWNGYPFAIENGIEIRYSEKTGYQVVYDESTNSPFTPISNNLLKKERRPGSDKWYLVVTLPVRQLFCQPTENQTSNASSGCQGTIQYQDYLYAVRAFLTRNGTKVEIPVSFDQDVFAPLQPQLSINLNTSENSFYYEIPDVYIANELGIGRVDIYTYTTKGELIGKDFSQTDVRTGISVNYQDYRYGAGTLGPYSDALKNSGNMVWKAVSLTSGGENALPFEQIKRSFLLGRRQRVLPITENNLVGTVEGRGYNSVKAIDYVTGRSYALTKELPRQENKKFYAPMSCFVGSYRASANDLVRSGTVLDNGQRITIPHNVLFDVSALVTDLVFQTTKNQYLALSSEELVDLVNEKTLTYLPFYYILDTTNKQANLRTYHLDAPVFNYQSFVAENSALGLEVGIGSIDIQHQDDGYLITIVTESGESYKELDNSQVNVQLSVLPMDSNSLASMAGTLYGVTEDGERIFQFKVGSRFDVDVNDVIYLSGFQQFGLPMSTVGTELKFNMTFLLTVEGDPEQSKSDSDAKLDQSLFATEQVAIIETDYNVTLGKNLSNLYSRVRPLIGEAQYKRYPADVPEVYPENTYLMEDGEYVFDDNNLRIIEHRAGDTVYNSDGLVRLKARAGDLIRDENNNPIELEPRDLQYHWDFIAFDGAYFFSKDEYDIEYAQTTKNIFVNVIGQDMDYFGEMAIDRTTLVYQPRNKLGYQKVIINSNAQTYLKQDLSFVVTYYLTKSGYKNQNLKETLQASTPRIINEWLYNATTTANSDLIALLKAQGAAEVPAVRVDAYAGNTIIDVISNADTLTGFSVRKQLRLTGDGLLSVTEDVDVTFLPHDVSMVSMGPV